jgi:oligoendopeptidase F
MYDRWTLTETNVGYWQRKVITFLTSAVALTTMNLEQWCQLDERIYVAESDERYKQYAGLPYSEKAIKRLAEIKNINAKTFLENFDKPRELVLGAIENIADSSTKKLELELYEARNKKVISKSFKFAGAPVNWSSWRQFNSKAKDDNARQKVFDEFIKKTKFVSPVIRRRFAEIRSVYEKYGADKKVPSPLDGYLENERINQSKLIHFVKSMGGQAKRPFREYLAEMSKQVLGREAEYYDDFYFFRNRVYSDIERHFAKVKPPTLVTELLERLQFNMSRINIDAQNRKNKYPSPICFFVRVPTDIRVLYKAESPYFDLQGCYHEMGHAMHASSVNEVATYWDRYGISMGVAEIFSIFLERLTKNRKYLKSIGITNEKVLDDLERRNNFMELFFVTFYSANSLMKADFWRKDLSMDKASDLYARLLKEYVGLEVPGEYWMLHHILPDAIMYVPSYMLAAVRAAELERHLQDRFGDEWWKEAKAGAHLREIMAPGASINLSEFSKMDASVFMKEITA